MSEVEQVPPGLKEDIEQIKTEGKEQSAVEAEVVTPKKRGRKPGSKNKPKDETPPLPEVDFPIEALQLMHSEIWGFISIKLRSDYRLSEQGAKEMAGFANLVLKQYLSPYLAQHMALAGYMITQLTALTTCIVLRRPKESKPNAEPISAN